MKCLLVDDEAGIREGLAALLRQRGHAIVTAADCAAAATALAIDTFDVVVSDWRLPDGVAATFLADCRCPVLAMSGHPEEVATLPAIVAVLTKPVLPGPLLQAIAAVAGPAANREPRLPPPDLARYPSDVRDAVATFRSTLPSDATIELLDDGTLLTVLARSGSMPRRTFDLRLCRRGRPRLDLPIVAWNAPWPARGEVAVDLHGATPSRAEFVACRQRALRRTTGRVQFLNVPPDLLAGDSQGTAHDMPMRDPVGPRLQAEHADLWSQP
jgi:CheY-like chemotaxis protein